MKKEIEEEQLKSSIKQLRSKKKILQDEVYELEILKIEFTRYNNSTITAPYREKISKLETSLSNAINDKLQICREKNKLEAENSKYESAISKLQKQNKKLESEVEIYACGCVITVLCLIPLCIKFFC